MLPHYVKRPKRFPQVLFVCFWLWAVATDVQINFQTWHEVSPKWLWYMPQGEKFVSQHAQGEKFLWIDFSQIKHGLMGNAWLLLHVHWSVQFNTVESVLKDHPFDHKNVVSQDRWSRVTGSVVLKCWPFCQKCVVFQDRWSHGSGLSWQVSLYSGPCSCIPLLFKHPCILRLAPLLHFQSKYPCILRQLLGRCTVGVYTVTCYVHVQWTLRNTQLNFLSSLCHERTVLKTVCSWHHSCIFNTVYIYIYTVWMLYM